MDQPLTQDGLAAEAVVSAGTRGCAKDGGLTPGESGGGENAPLFRPPARRLRAAGGKRGPPRKPGHSAREGTDVPGVSADVSRRNRVFAETQPLTQGGSAADAKGLGGRVSEDQPTGRGEGRGQRVGERKAAVG